MQKILTPTLLDTLISQGYSHCLSKITVIVGDDADICITLYPVKCVPEIYNLPENCDTFFEIDEEPRQMALGINETIVLVDLCNICLVN